MFNKGEATIDHREVEVKGEKFQLTAHKGRQKTEPWRVNHSFRGMHFEGKGKTSDAAFRDWAAKASIL